LTDTFACHTNCRDLNRRLRIGFVSPDFKDHPVIHFILPFLENYDRNQIELFVYSQVADLDEWTEMASKHVDHWRSLVHVPDVEAATLIRSDQIDILVDLAGHTNGNRLLVFAHKPAPIQVTYLGYPDTSGLAAMDYRITDALADPPGMTENHNTEQLIRLPGCAWCYGAYSDILPNKSPAAMNNYVTFGSFNNLAKVNDRMLRVWARILEAVPSSRLLLKAAGFRSMEARKRVREIFFLHSGIDEDRLDFRLPEEKHESHLALYGEMDIALDTFPYHGTTTTCEALWMGVPVVILEGKSHVSRVGVSLLTSIGLPEMVAVSEDEYVKIAVTLAGNVELLKSHRENLRDKLQNSRLLDGISFSRDLESVFRQMWKLWALNV
jgi:predicted O-linked N-acetylglucosamine transferase (SPINDLY family)